MFLQDDTDLFEHWSPQIAEGHLPRKNPEIYIRNRDLSDTSAP